MKLAATILLLVGANLFAADRQIVITWGAVEGAIGYRVYVANPPTADPVVVDSSSPSASVTFRRGYSVAWVTAYDAEGWESDRSLPVVVRIGSRAAANVVRLRK